VIWLFLDNKLDCVYKWSLITLFNIGICDIDNFLIILLDNDDDFIIPLLLFTLLVCYNIDLLNIFVLLFVIDELFNFVFIPLFIILLVLDYLDDTYWLIINGLIFDVLFAVVNLFLLLYILNPYVLRYLFC